MKLSDHVDSIKNIIYKAFDKQFSRLGIGANKTMELEKVPSELHNKREKLDQLLNSHLKETGTYAEAREKALDELTFTLFNRIAAVKVMEAHNLYPPIITKQSEHGDRSFGHKVWLEERPDMRNEELEGVREYIKCAFNDLGNDISLYHKDYPYALLPHVIELNEIIDAFNEVEQDAQVEKGIWESDDILGWLYESYNNVKKQAFKDSGEKTEYNKVSLQSQVYTPHWVVQFLVENSLGKLYLEMYPDSKIKKNHKIANAPKTQERKPKFLHEVRLIDPACGSGNFLLYAFDLFYELYIDQIENYGADYDKDDIPKLIIENNLHGIDLDDRAVQLAQLGLYIKAKRKQRDIGILHYNVISSDFFLPDYETTRHIFEESANLDRNQKELIEDIWGDLKYAYKFGSLIKIGEKVKGQVEALYEKQKRGDIDLFASADIEKHEAFEKIFFENLEKAIEKHAQKEGNSFLNSKTQDAITFLKLLTSKYDIATANPPYTDSADFGKELKSFIESNYKKPYKFNTNLYASFIKRCYDFIGEHGFVAMIHPLTFMYIMSFEDVRKFILTKTNINLLAELGLGGVFANANVQVDVCMYILEKGVNIDSGVYFDLKIYKNHTNKPSIFADIYQSYTDGITDEHVYSIPQPKLKIIKSWPFIYWISDEFREKFGTGEELEKILKAKKGLGTQSERFFRFWWEVAHNDISKKYKEDKKKWVRYVKGGPYKKWFGNIWLIINWEDNGKEIKENLKTNLRNPDTYFKEGIACSLLSSKGTSFRFQPENIIYDSTTRSIFFGNSIHVNKKYVLGFLNSKLCSYTLNCLNSTVAVNSNDIHRVPLSKVDNDVELFVSKLVESNVIINKHLTEFNIYEYEFKNSCLIKFNETKINHRIKFFFNYENHLLTQVLLNEAIINEKIFEVYDLTEYDKTMVIAKEGESIGGLPVSVEAKAAYLAEEEAIKEFPLDNISDFVLSLPVKEFATEERETIENELPTLYQGNNDLEEFCIRHQVNPINVWYWFKESNVIPKQRMNDIAMEFLADMIREILMEDEDGIIPLVTNAGEKILFDRIEVKFREKGFTMAQYSSFDTVLGRSLSEYLNKYFFAELSERLNLFRHLPMTPFIWHLTSGHEQGFDAYIIIYKWSRDKLFRLKSVYIELRERALINRQNDLVKDSSAKAQNEKDKIYKQLKEIKEYKLKIDELLEEGYDPILDDGVGKNIAPLQKKKMLAYEVLNAGQLEKYLNADW